MVEITSLFCRSRWWRCFPALFARDATSVLQLRVWKVLRRAPQSGMVFVSSFPHHFQVEFLHRELIQQQKQVDAMIRQTLNG
jgi:hypothetical protein